MPKKLRPTVDFMAFKCRTLRVKVYTTITVPAIFLGCGIWPLTLRDEHKLKVM